MLGPDNSQLGIFFLGQFMSAFKCLKYTIVAALNYSITIICMDEFLFLFGMSTSLLNLKLTGKIFFNTFWANFIKNENYQYN